jgi:hypothetical protein
MSLCRVATRQLRKVARMSLCRVATRQLRKVARMSLCRVATRQLRKVARMSLRSGEKCFTCYFSAISLSDLRRLLLLTLERVFPFRLLVCSVLALLRKSSVGSYSLLFCVDPCYALCLIKRLSQVTYRRHVSLTGHRIVFH